MQTTTATTKLNPVDCGKDDTSVMEAAFDGQRKRPVVAINREGHKVVCCLRTARKHGWKIEGRLFQKTKAKEEQPAKPAKAPATKKTNVIDTLNAEMAALAKKPAKAPAAKKTSTKKDPLLG